MTKYVLLSLIYRYEKPVLATGAVACVWGTVGWFIAGNTGKSLPSSDVGIAAAAELAAADVAAVVVVAVAVVGAGSAARSSRPSSSSPRAASSASKSS